jgi:hypothetical protein
VAVHGEDFQSYEKSKLNYKYWFDKIDQGIGPSGVRAGDIRHANKIPRTRVMTRMEGYGTPNVAFTAFNDSDYNVFACLMKRVLYVKYDGSNEYVEPIPQNDGPFEVLERYYKSIADYFPDDLEILTWDEVPKSMPVALRRRYETACKLLLTEGWDKRDYRKQCFLKFQKEGTTKGLVEMNVPLVDGTWRKIPIPRMICPSTAKYNAGFGRVFKVLEGYKGAKREHPMYTAIDLMVIARATGGPQNTKTMVSRESLPKNVSLALTRYDDPVVEYRTVLKGMNFQQWHDALFAAWARCGRGSIIAIDFKRMSTHFRGPAIKSEHSCYKRLARKVQMTNVERLEFRLLLLRQFKFIKVWKTYNRETQEKIAMQFDKVMKYDGDLNTAPGAVVVMLCMILLFFDQKRLEVHIGNNGDDNALFVSDYTRSQFTNEEFVAHFRKFGFVLGIDGETKVFEQLSFCQHSPCIINGKRTMVRKAEMLIKDTYALADKKKAIKVFDCMRTAGMKVYKHCPVLYAFYRSFPSIPYDKRKRKENRITRDRLMQYNSLITGAYGMHTDSRPHCVTEEDRFNYFQSTGIPPEAQRMLEHRYDNMKLASDPEEEVREYWIPPPIW